MCRGIVGGRDTCTGTVSPTCVPTALTQQNKSHAKHLCAQPQCWLWQGPWGEILHHKHLTPAKYAFTMGRKVVRGAEFPLSVDNYCCL